MSEPLTPEQYQDFTRKLDNVLGQYFEGYAIVGYHAITKEPVGFRNAMLPSINHGLNHMLLLSSQIQVLNTPPPEDGKIAE